MVKGSPFCLNSRQETHIIKATQVSFSSVMDEDVSNEGCIQVNHC